MTEVAGSGLARPLGLITVGAMNRRTLLRLWAALGAGAWLGRAAREATAAPAAGIVSELEQADLIYVSTRRRSGDWSTEAPIWFCWLDAEIMFTTSPGSWKARRLGDSGPVRIHVGSAEGPEILAVAERLRDPEIVERMGRAYDNKYWIAWFGFFRPRSDRVSDGRTIAYRVRLS